MVYRLLADLVLAVHLAFVLFVVAGGFLVAWRWGLRWLHLPAAAWGALISLAGWVCPLTPLENHLRRLGGAAGYEGGFIEHYIVSVLYPAGLTRGHQLLLAAGVVAVNLALYGWVLRRRRTASVDRARAPVHSQ
jgi:hypothetical protein